MVWIDMQRKLICYADSLKGNSAKWINMVHHWMQEESRIRRGHALEDGWQWQNVDDKGRKLIWAKDKAEA